MPKVEVPRRWPDATIVCMASGPSLTQHDCDYVRGKAPVIVVNDAVRLAPWADVLYSSDRAWFEHYKGCPTFQGQKYAIGSSVGKANGFHRHPDIAVVRNTGYDGLELDPSGIRNGKNSGYAAINLAVHFGASRILLLGYNMGWPGGRAHFFGDHPPRLAQHERLYPTFRRLFATMVEPLRTRGVAVINCTEHSSLDAFPRAALREVLGVAHEVAV